MAFTDGHLHKKNDLLRAGEILYIPEMHAKSRINSCQVQFAPRSFAGLGKIDGEEAERLWSSIRKASSHTINMRPSRRHDGIAECRFWGD